jgi:hypothetical protein
MKRRRSWLHARRAEHAADGIVAMERQHTFAATTRETIIEMKMTTLRVCATFVLPRSA